MPAKTKYSRRVMLDKYNHVGKYDTLVVWQRPDGMRWSVTKEMWVTAESGHFTSWLDEDDRPELDEWLIRHPGQLPLLEGGEWVNINEA